MILLNSAVSASILKEGMMIGVRLGTVVPWHGNIVYGVAGDTIRVAYIDKYMKGISSPGCDAWIKYSNDYFVYYFSGKVKSVSKEQPEYVSIKIETAEEILNNRLFPRYDVRVKALIKPVWDDEVYDCTITDLSYGGAAFICAKKFDGNEQLEITMHLPGGATAEVTGKVVRRKSSQITITDHSVQFVECDNVNNKLLSEFFSKLEDEISEIYNNYVTVIKRKHSLTSQV